jgi:hypothetical protein
MSSTRPAGPETAVDQDGRPVVVSGRQGRRGASGVAAGAGLLTRVVQLVVSIVVFIIVAGILLVVLKANPSNGIVSELPRRSVRRHVQLPQRQRRDRRELGHSGGCLPVRRRSVHAPVRPHLPLGPTRSSSRHANQEAS